MLHERKVKNLYVEIADSQAYRLERIFPINSDHRLVQLWPRKIRALVLDLLEFVKFSELGVYKYGFTADTAVPTITITVKDPSFGIREELKTAIAQVCATNGAPGMRVAVIYDEARMHDDTVIDAAYEQGLQANVTQPGMGHSIGIDNVAAGSLGGYIVLVDDHNRVRQDAFLTCWHVLRPGTKNVLPGKSHSLKCQCPRVDHQRL